MGQNGMSTWEVKASKKRARFFYPFLVASTVALLALGSIVVLEVLHSNSLSNNQTSNVCVTKECVTAGMLYIDGIVIVSGYVHHFTKRTLTKYLPKHFITNKSRFS